MKLNPFAIALTVSLLTGCGLYESHSTSEVVDPGPGRPVVAEQSVMVDLSAQHKHKSVGLMKREADWSGQAVAPSQVATVSSGIRLPSERLDRESYARIEDNAVKRVQEVPVSTFSIDVDTGSYANLRRILKEGRLPPKDAVRVEEMINYFTYDDTVPKEKSQPFSITTELGPNPWNQETRLLRVGLRSWVSQDVERPSANLVFLVVDGGKNPNIIGEQR